MAPSLVILRSRSEPEYVLGGYLSRQDLLVCLHVCQSLYHLEIFFVNIKDLSLSVNQIAVWDGLHSLCNSAWHLYGLGRPMIVGLLLCILMKWHKCRTIVACQVVNILAVLLVYHYICKVCFSALDV